MSANNEIPLIKCEEIYSLDKDHLVKLLNEKFFVIIRGLFDSKKIFNSLKILKSNFSHKNDRIRSLKEYDRIKSNYQRFMFGMTGGVRGIQNTTPRYHRVFYNPLWEKDIYQAHDLFKKQLELQNYIYDLPKDYGKKGKKTKHGLFVASRIQHYPSGGGFLSSHIDSGAIRASNELKLNLHFNLLLIMTKKGVDFKSGGGFVMKNDEIVKFEDHCQVGDVVIYSGKTVHGVIDIDPDKFPDLNSSDGRYVGLTTLFKW